MRQFATIVALVVSLAMVSVATTVVPLSVEELTARSSFVVEGRAGEQWSDWDASSHLIYTYTRFTVTRSLKGVAPATIVVRQMGGSAGGYTQKVSGVRHWISGDEAVLFLRSSVAADGSLAVVGLMQGNFAVVHSTGATYVTNGVSNVSAASSSGIANYTGSRMSLSDLEQRVRKAVQ